MLRLISMLWLFTATTPFIWLMNNLARVRNRIWPRFIPGLNAAFHSKLHFVHVEPSVAGPLLPRPNQLGAAPTIARFRPRFHCTLVSGLRPGVISNDREALGAPRLDSTDERSDSLKSQPLQSLSARRALEVRSA
jgi:hypothetical protein